MKKKNDLCLCIYYLSGSIFLKGEEGLDVSNIKLSISFVFLFFSSLFFNDGMASLEEES
jgi:hypothetical protein